MIGLDHEQGFIRLFGKLGGTPGNRIANLDSNGSVFSSLVKAIKIRLRRWFERLDVAIHTRIMSQFKAYVFKPPRLGSLIDLLRRASVNI